MFGSSKKAELKFFDKVWFSEKELENVSKIVSPETGKCMVLPYDQFVEHDNRHSFAHARANDPDYIMELAIEGGFNAVAVHYGVAKRFWKKWNGMPLILKINGKTSIPSQEKALSTHTSFVEDAMKIGAAAVGYTLYYGSPRQDEDIMQLANVRKECEKYGLPLVVWAYPRGIAMDKKGGAKTSYALESAARMAVEMGATIVKSNIPSAMMEGDLENALIPKEFRDFERSLAGMSEKEQKLIRCQRVVDACAGIPVLFSGGGKKSTEEVIENTEICNQAGALGLIYGRNMWKRPKKEAIPLAKKLRGIIDA